jgi:putative sterol carrier protein
VAAADEVTRALDGFVERFAAEPRLKAMTAGWDRTIEVRADDLPEPYWLRVEGGLLRRADAAPGKPDMAMSASSDLIRDLFSGRISPTEPYLTGDLRLVASEADVMRLDVITLMVWGE